MVGWLELRMPKIKSKDLLTVAEIPLSCPSRNGEGRAGKGGVNRGSLRGERLFSVGVGDEVLVPVSTGSGRVAGLREVRA